MTTALVVKAPSSEVLRNVTRARIVAERAERRAKQTAERIRRRSEPFNPIRGLARVAP
jgi:hypothetical protein